MTPDGKIEAVIGPLELLLDPLDRLLANAEIDDEPVTPEDIRDIAASREWFKNNKGTPFDSPKPD